MKSSSATQYLKDSETLEMANTHWRNESLVIYIKYNTAKFVLRS